MSGVGVVFVVVSACLSSLSLLLPLFAVGASAAAAAAKHPEPPPPLPPERAVGVDQQAPPLPQIATTPSRKLRYSGNLTKKHHT